ncbi:MAG: pyridoxal phosphate-dependent aminotransferase, partial [Pseudomonadota bacterium]|nr:pyridoxal phosphate-dependent aminotransferase [Pseudomonadota bacterium]
MAKAAEALRRQGVDVVDFGPGEPDFDTPPAIRDAAIQALEQGLTHYAPSRGYLELRRAIAGKLQRENNLHYDPETEVLVTPGAKQAILEAMLTAVDAGDEVIVFDPGWGSYAAICRLANATPVQVSLLPDFSIDPERLLSAISSRTRAVIVGSPGNPTGHVLTTAELQILRAVCQEHDLLLISDEIYERITYDGIEARSPAALTGMRERTVTINGFSKAYAMTGWRLGYAAAPAPFVAQMLKVHEHSVTTATSFVQAGGTAALNGSHVPIRDMVAEFARRRTLIVDGLNQLPGFRCSPPDGAFYVFPDITGTGFSGTELTRLLLDHGVVVTPGIGFGAAWDNHVRLSYATSEERIHTGLA